MEVNLTYKTNLENLHLKKGNIKDLDYETFSLRSEDKLRSKYNLDGIDGKFLITYDPSNFSLDTLYLYNFLGEEIEEEKYLSVDYNTRPYLIDMKRDIYALLSDFEVVKKFYEVIKDSLTSEENLYFTYGVAYQNKDLCNKVIDKFLEERLESEEGYFLARLIKEEIMKAKSAEDMNKKSK